MTEYHTIYEGPEGESTEWDDIQARLGNRPAKKEVWKPEKFAPEEEAAGPSSDGIDALDEEGLAELEDDLDDDRALAAYRAKRLAELRAGRAGKDRPRFGEYREISRSAFVPDVTNAPRGAWVVVHLFSPEVRGCAIMDRCLGELASRWPETSFLRIRSTECIPGYPDANLPTVLVYRDGKARATIARLEKFGGEATSPDLVELALNSVGDVCGDSDPATTAQRVTAILEQAARRKEEAQRREEDERGDD